MEPDAAFFFGLFGAEKKIIEFTIGEVWPKDRLCARAHVDYALVSVMRSFVLGRRVRPNEARCVYIFFLYYDQLVRTGRSQKLKLDEGGYLLRDVRVDGFDVSFRHGTDWLGFFSGASSALQAWDGS